MNARLSILRLASSLALVALTTCSYEDVVWPIANSSAANADRISSPYGPRDQSGKHDFHAGVDFAVPEGTKIRAIKAGTVEKTVDWDGESGTGNWVLIDHGAGEKSAYLHLSKIKTKAGASVHAGEVIGRSGSTGGTTPHLHLTYMREVDKNGADETRARNALEILPHDPMPEPEVAWDSDAVILELDVATMTVQRVVLEGEDQDQLLELDYAAVFARGNPERDEPLQDGVHMQVENLEGERFALTLRPDSGFVPQRVSLYDFADELVFEATR